MRRNCATAAVCGIGDGLMRGPGQVADLVAVAADAGGVAVGWGRGLRRRRPTVL
jgi:hypothetical protein